MNPSKRVCGACLLLRSKVHDNMRSAEGGYFPKMQMRSLSTVHDISGGQKTWKAVPGAVITGTL